MKNVPNFCGEQKNSKQEGLAVAKEFNLSHRELLNVYLNVYFWFNLTVYNNFS